jgi:ABC-type uncharacterized transport system substrate-binding protein
MKRREFVTLIGGAAAWPLSARAQQATTPVVGYLDSRPPESVADRLRGFRQGLKDTGYIEGENLTIAYKWAEDRIDRLPTLAADLVNRSVAAIATSGPPSSFAAKTATATIPIVFMVGVDPVQLGLTTSLSRPSGNLTGINILNSELAAKRLELLTISVFSRARLPYRLTWLNAATTVPGWTYRHAWNRRPTVSSPCIPLAGARRRNRE